MKVQFILKKNETYGFVSYTRRSSGLWNSTQFIVEALNDAGVIAEIVEVNDNNDIDREVTRFSPDIVAIEALWVVPSKFDVLKRLHPKVKWCVHMHSGLPFLSIEGIAIDWIKGYDARDIKIIANDEATFNCFKTVVQSKNLVILTNVYNRTVLKPSKPFNDGCIRIGCFGAIRPLKNQLIQAMAAIRFAKELKKDLRFFVNSTRIETGGQPVLKNIRALFKDTPNATLIECDWMEQEDFLSVLQSLDIGMQVSLTETFNVVTANYVTAGLPVVVSDAITWVNPFCKADTNDIDAIVGKIHYVYGKRWLVSWNQMRLDKFSERSKKMWKRFCTNADYPYF